MLRAVAGAFDGLARALLALERERPALLDVLAGLVIGRMLLAVVAFADFPALAALSGARHSPARAVVFHLGCRLKVVG